jgi:hypothetical protein
VTWAVNHEAQTVSWMMVVIEEKLLLQLCGKHSEKVEQYASMNLDALEVSHTNKKENTL